MSVRVKKFTISLPIPTHAHLVADVHAGEAEDVSKRINELLHYGWNYQRDRLDGVKDVQKP